MFAFLALVIKTQPQQGGAFSQRKISVGTAVTDKMDHGRFVLTARMATGTGRRKVTEFFDEPLRGFVCERAAVQSAEFVLIQHMVKIAWGMRDVSQVCESGGGHYH